MGQQTKCPFHWCRKQVCSPRSHGGISMGRMRRALQQRLPVAAGAATLTVFLAAVILLPKTTSEILRDSAFDIELAGDQWLRRPAPSDLKVIVVDIDRASIDALGTGPWPRETGAARRGGGDRAAPLTRPRHGAFIMPMRAIMVGPFFSATRIRHSIAACHSPRFCSALGSFMM